MPVIGLSFNSIVGKKNKISVKGQVQVNSTPRIIDIKEITVPTLNKKALSISFEFTTKYDPDIAEVKIGGDILYLHKNAAAFLKAWKKDKKLPQDATMEVMNHLFRKCLLKISLISEDLQLPPPLQFPRIKPSGQQQQSSYIG